MIADPELRRRLGAAGRRTVEADYDVERGRGQARNHLFFRVEHRASQMGVTR